ncbi:MAG: TetR/AcrR family transcriptional regulator [Bacteroidales bacterium]|jgi:AcrR family transcriptional regulator|nr:TetR/AcrR family transcriptional regulator [Bacteroidales bacterium]
MAGVKPESDTEKRILDASIKIFCRDGIQGARMQDIADLAHINRAMIHYYFRDKEILSHKALEKIVANFHTKIHKTIDADLPFEEKLDKYINEIIEIYSSNKDLVIFGLHESMKNKELLSRIFTNQIDEPHLFFRQLEEKVKKGEIRKFKRGEFITLVSSICAYPFVCGPILKMILEYNEKEWETFITEYKKRIPGIIKSTIYQNYNNK